MLWFDGMVKISNVWNNTIPTNFSKYVFFWSFMSKNHHCKDAPIVPQKQRSLKGFSEILILFYRQSFVIGSNYKARLFSIIKK
jgi:hypothetical protein